MIIKISIIAFFLIICFHSSHGQALCNPSSQLQGLTSGRGSTIPTKMPSIIYESNLNQFTVSIFNNNEILSQSQCSNLNGPFFNNPGSSTFTISLVCSGPENNGAGLTGGIAIPMSNSSEFLTSVVISTGATYSTIPVKLSNGISLANRQCSLTLQSTLYQILPDNVCFPCANYPIETVVISTGPPGFSGGCCWTCLTCYSDLGVLWTSTFMWIWIDIGTVVVIILCCLIWLVYSKQRRWNAVLSSYSEVRSKAVLEKVIPEKTVDISTTLSEVKPASSSGVTTFPMAPSAGKKHKKDKKQKDLYEPEKYSGPSKKTSHGVYHALPLTTEPDRSTAAAPLNLRVNKQPAPTSSFYNR